MKNKGIALLLAIFLGWMGGHRYYLGQTSTAVLFSLFFWTGIPFVISIIDFFIILLSSQERIQARFGIKISPETNFSQVKISSIEELERLAKLKEGGYITEEEFEKKKKELI